MSALTLISGKLQGEPVTRPTRNGGQVTFFKLRVQNGAALEWWDVATFSDTARDELEGLGEGDALSAVGAFHVEMVEYKGEQRIKRSLTAERILALKPKSKEAKPKANKPARAAPATAASGLAPNSWDDGGPDDEIPF
jgi:single-stranded DNA-binding protein